MLTLVDATAAPVLVAVISDNDTALLLADRSGAHQWITGLGAPADSAGRTREAMQRLLATRPHRTDGRLIKNNLGKEAQVSRAP